MYNWSYGPVGSSMAMKHVEGGSNGYGTSHDSTYNGGNPNTSSAFISNFFGKALSKHYKIPAYTADKNMFA